MFGIEVPFIWYWKIFISSKHKNFRWVPSEISVCDTSSALASTNRYILRYISTAFSHFHNTLLFLDDEGPTFLKHVVIWSCILCWLLMWCKMMAERRSSSTFQDNISLRCASLSYFMVYICQSFCVNYTFGHIELRAFLLHYLSFILSRYASKLILWFRQFLSSL